MMEAVRTSETSVDNHFTRQYNPEDSSEHHTRRRENLKSHAMVNFLTLLLRSREVFGPEDGYPDWDFLWFSLVPPGKYRDTTFKL
jgi:hypothetical protein